MKLDANVQAAYKVTRKTTAMLLWKCVTGKYLWYLDIGLRTMASKSSSGNQSWSNFSTHNSISFTEFVNIHFYNKNNKFFSDCRYVPYLQRYSPTKLCDGAQMAIFSTFLRPVFSANDVQQVSDLHLKFALRPHHVWKYGRHPICGAWD